MKNRGAHLILAAILVASAASPAMASSHTDDKCMVQLPQKTWLQFWIPCASGFFDRWWR